MKAFFLGLLLASSAAHAAPLLSKIEQEDLLLSIDNICGDTWCEGDSNWSFDAIRCDSETGCVLDLTMKPYDFNEDQILFDRPFQCSLPTFTAKTSLVEKTIRGLQYTQGLYDALSHCIGNLSENFGPIYVPIDNKCSSLFGPKSESFVYVTTKEAHSSGVHAAIEAISQIVAKQSKKDPSCELTREPYYRDAAICESLTRVTSQNDGKGSAVEVCTLPTVDGSFKVTRDETGRAVVEYSLGVIFANAYKEKIKPSDPCHNKPLNNF
ncbi:MAG: hypothetical protein H7318_20330 [Oligoflexus sp.]|nr:hypothetical protein [Oligoflexus sp.]